MSAKRCPVCSSLKCVNSSPVVYRYNTVHWNTIYLSSNAVINTKISPNFKYTMCIPYPAILGEPSIVFSPLDLFDRFFSTATHSLTSRFVVGAGLGCGTMLLVPVTRAVASQNVSDTQQGNTYSDNT